MFILQKKKTAGGKTGPPSCWLAGWLAGWLVTPLPPLRRRTRRHGRQKHATTEKKTKTETLKNWDWPRERRKRIRARENKTPRARERKSPGRDRYIPGK